MRRLFAPCALAALVALAPTTLAQREQPFSKGSFTPDRWEAELAYERTLRDAVDKASIKWFHDRLADEPNRAGTKRSRKTAEWIMSQFSRAGLEASLAEYDVLLAEPIDAQVQVVAPERIDLPVRERVLSEDPYSAIAQNEFGWNAYSASGDATGRVVYANYGRKEDFEALRAMGIDLQGAIVIARYGGNFRGFKAKFAEEAGAAALIIYTDPADAGKGDPYPEGVWANGSTIQRGSILTNEHRGDPLTPGWASTPSAKRLEIEEAGLPRIPVQPIGWDAAREILARMEGPDAPEGWKGGLDAPYTIGGEGDLRVRVKVAQARTRKTIANPVGVLRGSEEPDKLVIVGCHFDAWVYGAWDPASGMSVVMELARVFGEAAQNGHRPKRTVMFVAWDAEEYGLIGSTEWVEQNARDLVRNAVAYINLDAAVSGSRFAASAWPSLKTLVAESAGAVPALLPATDSTPTVLDEWIGAQGGDDLTPRIGDMGGGSDHSAFVFHLGIPAAAPGVVGAPGANYHSVYDSLRWYQQRFVPDYEPSAKLARVVAVQLARLANADVAPVDHGRTFADFVSRLDEAAAIARERGMTIDVDRLRGRAEFLAGRWDQAIGAVRAALAAGTLDDSRRTAVNGLLGVLDRTWVESAAESEGRWHRNLYMGPDEDSGYAPWALPPLRRAVEHGDRGAAQAAIARYNRAFDQMAAMLMALEMAARPE